MARYKYAYLLIIIDKMPRILFVAMTESIHTARWLNELKDTGWQLNIFPSADMRVHPELKNVTVHGFDYSPTRMNDLYFAGAFPVPLPEIFNSATTLLRQYKERNDIMYRAKKLVKIIKIIKPDIIHSLEMQHSGYLTLQAKEIIGDDFPPWIYTPWGNDIYFFGRFKDHSDKIKKVLSQCNYYIPKSDRDIKLAKEFGFGGKILTKLPGNGGLDIEGLKRYWRGKPSDRKCIMVKGYQGSMNRALVALHAIELCADNLTDYELFVYSAVTEDVKIKTELIKNDTGLNISILPPLSHEEMLKLYGKSKVSISINLTDGVSNSLLESMAMGTFPIESNTSCANEWIVPGDTGCIVPPENPKYIANAISFALQNDHLLDRASEKNFDIARAIIDRSVINPKIVGLYDEVLKNGKR
jgi:glycosyltransferase involved in cell wall biosynthesis